MNPETIGLVESDIVECVKCYIQDKRNRVNGKFRLVSYQVQRLCEEPVGYLGDHYLLDVNLREKMVHYTPEEEEKYAEEEYISFFVKVIPEHVPKLADYIKEMGCFRKEILLYKHVIPRLQDVMIGTRPFVPTAYFTKGERMIVFENLKSEGYSIVENTKNLLDFDHLKVALQAIAKLHASSLILEERSKTPIPKLFAGYLNENAYVDDDDHVRKINLENAIQVLCEMIKKIDKYARSDKLDEILEKVPAVVRKIYDFAKPSAVFRNVLNHGDLWCNNVMFRYEMIPTSVDGGINEEGHPAEGRKATSDREDQQEAEKNATADTANSSSQLMMANTSSMKLTPVEAKLVDFQLARYAPPVLDVWTLIMLCSSRDFRRQHLQTLLNIYYQTLGDLLESGCNGMRVEMIIPRAEYDAACEHFALAGLIESLLFGHITLLPKQAAKKMLNSSENFDSFLRDSGKQRICLGAFEEAATYRSRMSEMLTELVDKFIH
uniref:CHK domain-containing protein n=1 Tax=Anopheles funestus TaxID=62324 RepID=A0A4Y0BW49_ANOFN